MNSTVSNPATNLSITTQPPPPSLDTKTLITNCVYIVEGFGMVLANFLIVVAILSSKSLRRTELYITAALAFSECLYGLGYLVSGCRRIVLVLTGKDNVLVTAWTCLLQVDTPLFVVGGQIAFLMLVVVSVDRLLAVRWFGMYMGLTKRYAFGVIGAVYGFGAVSLTVVYITTYFFTSPEAKFKSLCIGSWGLTTGYDYFNTVFKQICGVTSVGIYVFVMVGYIRQGKALKNTVLRNIHMRRQRQLTKVLGMCSLFTFCFLVLPTTIIFCVQILNVKNDLFVVLNPYTWQVVPVYCIANIFFYSWKHEDIRLRLRVMFCCNRMLADMESKRSSKVQPFTITILNDLVNDNTTKFQFSQRGLEECTL